MSFPSELARMVAAIPPGLETKEAPDLEIQIKAIKDEILAGIGGSAEKMSQMQRQLDALDSKLAEKHAAGYAGKSLVEHLQEQEAVSRLIRDRKGQAAFTIPAQYLERKATTFLETGSTIVTPGVFDADRAQAIVPEARRKLSVRNVLSARPTTLPLVYWVKVNAPMVVGSPMFQDEGLVQFQQSITFTTANSTIRTIATFLRASKQSIDDFTELSGFLQSSLGYYCSLAEDQALLSGDNTGDNLNGLITQATAFNTALLPAASAYTRIDMLGAAIEQIAIANEIQPDFIVLNSQDWWATRRTKDGFGRYILGDPQSAGDPNIWGLQVVSTNSIAAGTFLVGSGNPAASEIRDRQELEILISTEDQDNFVRGLVSIRAEKRMCLAVSRPGSYITGSLITSP